MLHRDVMLTQYGYMMRLLLLHVIRPSVRPSARSRSYIKTTICSIVQKRRTITQVL